MKTSIIENAFKAETENATTTLEQAIESINFDESGNVGGEFGIHHGFLNALVNINSVNYYVQGCADGNDFNADDCGHDDGICGDVNNILAEKLAEDHDDDISKGFDLVKDILSAAYIKHLS